MEELLLGASLGWAAGVVPGPLVMLVVTTALQRGFAAGARVAVAPLLTDAPIIALAVLAAARLPAVWEEGLAVGGGLYLLYLGADTVRTAFRSVGGAPPVGGGADLRRGTLTNLLSPHPWLFWATVGGPVLARAWGRTPWAGIGFLVGFFGLLVGTKVGIAALAGNGSRLLSARWYHRLTVAAGGLMGGAGVVLVVRALG